MPATANPRPLAVLLLLAAVLLAASSRPAAAAVVAGKHGGGGGGRMVIIRTPGTRVATGGARHGEWRYDYGRRRLEDEVAPELVVGGLLGADDGRIGYDALDKNKPGCKSSSQCAAKGPGGSYLRPCTYQQQCRQ